jgi:hypothetical protein
MLVHFYRIVADGGDEEYIGSTKGLLQKRWSNHKSHFRNNRVQSNSKFLFEKHGIDACRIELIETRECATDEERWKYEGDLIRASLKCVNRCIAGRTTAERRAENPELIIERDKAYRESHKDEISAAQHKYHQAHREERNAKTRERRCLAKLTPAPSTA